MRQERGGGGGGGGGLKVCLREGVGCGGRGCKRRDGPIDHETGKDCVNGGCVCVWGGGGGGGGGGCERG